MERRRRSGRSRRGRRRVCALHRTLHRPREAHPRGLSHAVRRRGVPATEVQEFQTMGGPRRGRARVDVGDARGITRRRRVRRRRRNRRRRRRKSENRGDVADDGDGVRGDPRDRLTRRGGTRTRPTRGGRPIGRDGANIGRADAETDAETDASKPTPRRPRRVARLPRRRRLAGARVHPRRRRRRASRWTGVTIRGPSRWNGGDGEKRREVAYREVFLHHVLASPEPVPGTGTGVASTSRRTLGIL